MSIAGKHRVSLWQIAHARSGDKGSRLNIAVFADAPAFWPAMVEQVTEALVAELFVHRPVTKVRRYELPRLQALNFVIDNVLEGGVNGALNLDGHGKCLSYRLLSAQIEIDTQLLPQLHGGVSG